MLILMRLLRTTFQRTKIISELAFLGRESKDTVFSSVDYAKLNAAVANAFDIGVKKGQKNAFCY
jgi:hypothetical protein